MTNQVVNRPNNKILMEQCTNNILMIRPIGFRMNEQTAVNNFFMEDIEIKNAEINRKAQMEFDEFVDRLKSAGINVIVENDDKLMDTPDSIFPNNWVSFHANGDVAIYPMYAENRRKERRDEIFLRLEQEGFKIENIIDYTSAEDFGLYLEGTGSLVLDRVNKKAYCALSARADEELVIEFCEDFEYTPIIFTAYQTVDDKRLPIYHTNVMMCVGRHLAIICLDSIDDKKERKMVLSQLKADNKDIVEISEQQMHNFAGNMLEVFGKDGQALLIMSKAAYDSLEQTQIDTIEKYCEILYSDIETIETCGGGSVRCMIAEIFLPKS